MTVIWWTFFNNRNNGNFVISGSAIQKQTLFYKMQYCMQFIRNFLHALLIPTATWVS